MPKPPDDLHEQPDDLHEQPGKGNDRSDLIKWLPIMMQCCAHSQSCKAACRTKCSILLSIHFLAKIVHTQHVKLGNGSTAHNFELMRHVSFYKKLCWPPKLSLSCLKFVLLKNPVYHAKTARQCALGARGKGNAESYPAL